MDIIIISLNGTYSRHDIVEILLRISHIRLAQRTIKPHTSPVERGKTSHTGTDELYSIHLMLSYEFIFS